MAAKSARGASSKGNAPTIVGRFLRAARQRKDWSIRELARRSDVSATVISRIESGQRATLEFENLCRLADKLDFSLDELGAAAGFMAGREDSELGAASRRLRQGALNVRELLKKAQARLDGVLDD